MQILILASMSELGKKWQVSVADAADRCTVVTTWSEVTSALERSTPSVMIIERAALQRMELSSLLSLTQPGHWPPLILVGESEAGARDALTIAKRLTWEPPPFYEIGDLRVDTRRKRATIGGQWVTMPPIQYRLLLTLAQRAGEVVGCQELLKMVWGHEAGEIEARELVKVHIRQIRRRLGLDPQKHHYIQSVRGFGYVLAPPEELIRTGGDLPSLTEPAT